MAEIFYILPLLIGLSLRLLVLKRKKKSPWSFKIFWLGWVPENIPQKLLKWTCGQSWKIAQLILNVSGKKEKKRQKEKTQCIYRLIILNNGSVWILYIFAFVRYIRTKLRWFIITSMNNKYRLSLQSICEQHFRWKEFYLKNYL